MQHLEYSVVIATRNRPDALRLSIPRMLKQTRPPSQLIVVDSSDNHEATVEAVNEASEGSSISCVIIASEPGLTKQRNRGLDEVEHPITFFPDDDSIWFPEVAAKKMAVYEADSSRKVSAVCGREVMTPPKDFGVEKILYSMKSSDKLRQKVAFLRRLHEGKLAEDPARVLGKSFIAEFKNQFPTLGSKDEIVPVEWMTGFRMSFRTEVIREVRFNEIFTNYSLFEDIDASFGTWSHGAVVAANSAHIYHHKSPERRDSGRQLGAQQLINKAYVVAKYCSINHPARSAIVPFSVFKLLQYLSAISNQFGRERFLGALSALLKMKELRRANPENADEVYLRTLKNCGL